MAEEASEAAVLFADVSGSTKLYEAVGDAAAHEAIDLCVKVQDHGTRDHPAEAREVATPKRRVRVSIGHPLRSLSQVCSSRCTTTSAHAPRGTGEARKLSQRDRATIGAGRAHTSASDRVTRPAVVMSVAAVSV